MKAIELDITIGQEGKAAIEIQVPADVEPGKHRAIVVLDERALDLSPSDQSSTPPPLDFPQHDFGPWPDNLSLRREDLYGDEGR